MKYIEQQKEKGDKIKNESLPVFQRYSMSQADHIIVKLKLLGFDKPQFAGGGIG